MVAIDNVASVSPRLPQEGTHAGSIILLSILLSALLVVASLSVAVDGNGWNLAADMVSRLSLLLFVAMMVVEPLSRLVPNRFTAAAAQDRWGLVLGFVAAAAMSLICIAAPAQLGGARLAAPTIAYCVLSAAILAVLLFVTHPATRRHFGGPAWRAMQRVAASYFWLAFLLTGIERTVGPHRPDDWHGFSLLLLTAALLLRFADAFRAHRSALAEKVA